MSRPASNHRPGPAARALLLGATIALAGCGSLRGDPGPDADRLYGEFPTGAPRDCVAVRDLEHIVPVGNHTMLFYMASGDVWRNRLAQPCPGLRKDSILSYELRSSRLCSHDFVTQLDRNGTELRAGANCVLGQFDYLTEDQAEALRQYH